MLQFIVHRLAAIPTVYDAIQYLVGVRTVHRKLAALIAEVEQPARIVDFGGGTGLTRPLWSPSSTYTCVDLDQRKLQAFRKGCASGRISAGAAVCATVEVLPLRTGCVDVVTCTMVTHHLDDRALMLMVSEARRILRPEGTLILVDAVWEPARWMGRLLWRYDRGAFPRPDERLRAILAMHFTCVRWESFDVIHRYTFWEGMPSGQTR